MANTFRPDRKGISEILKKQTAGAINGLASQIHSQAQASVYSDVEVTMEPYTTDRAAASVTIADPRGLEMQARDGVLTRAAATLGLEVRSK